MPSQTAGTDEQIMTRMGRHTFKRARIEAQPTVTTVVLPTDEDLAKARARTPDGEAMRFEPIIVRIEGTEYPITPGEEVTLPQTVWQVFAASRRLPTLKASAGFFQRPISDDDSGPSLLR